MQHCQRATLKVRFHTTGRIQGVAYLDDVVSKIYAVCESCSTVNVFHAMPPYEQLRGIHVSGLRGPTDIVACTTNRLLYVSDQVEACVWQVTTGGKADWHDLTWSPTKRKASSVFPVSLSVRRGRLVVVEVRNVLIYDLHGSKLDEIKFADFITLRHAVESDRQSVMVALSDSSEHTDSSLIQEMRSDASRKWSPVRQWNLTSSNPGQPLYMAWDMLGFLHVSIHNSCKVLVLDSALNEVQSVRLNRRSMPSQLCCLSQRRKLFLTVAFGAEVRMYGDVISSMLYPEIQRNVTL